MIHHDSTTARSHDDDRAVAAARAIALTVVEGKGHGHAGTAMGAAPLAHVLFQHVLRHDPSDPSWQGRDRFILSAGHASLLLYIQLHLTGYDLGLDEIGSARQFGSRTPGHPEIDVTPGVEMSTGPLGQGVASAVGVAAASRHASEALDGDAEPMFDPTIWVLAGDGCLQEGVSAEASSLAGTLGLDNLVLIWDDNGITIDGPTSVAFSEDVRARYRAYGWRVLEIDDVEDLDAVRDVLTEAAARTGRPTLVAARSDIGFPAPHRRGTSAAHAGAFGAQEFSDTMAALGYPADATLASLVTDDVREHTLRAAARGRALRGEWDAALAARDAERPDLLSRRRAMHDSTAQVTAALAAIDALPPVADVATRTASGEVLTAVHAAVPLWGGSADLAGSTSVAVPGETFGPTCYGGSSVAFGIREHAMAAFASGVALHGLWRPYASTYLAFSDYMRPALRLAALMELPTIMVFTHDSVAVGEDGPTHQPIEQVASLRTVPGMSVVRPADAAETRAVWRRVIAEPDGPVSLILSRQTLPCLPEAGDAARGGRVVLTHGDGMGVALIATGSEVHVAVEAARALAAEGHSVRVVSMPCVEWFEAQDSDYRESVLPRAVRARVAVEAGVGAAWWRYAGDAGRVVSVESFGVSGPGARVMEHLGITVEAVISAAHESIEEVGR